MARTIQYKGMYWEQSETVTYPERLNSTFALDKYETIKLTFLTVNVSTLNIVKKG